MRLPLWPAVALLASCQCGGEPTGPAAAPAAPRAWVAGGADEAGLTRAVLLRDDGILLRATPDGVERSEDGGASWALRSAAGTALPDGAITALLPLAGDAVLAWVHGEGALRSLDNGDSWLPVARPPELRAAAGVLNPRGRAVPRATAITDDGVTWMAAVGGLFRSDDGGETWTEADLTSAGAYNLLFTDVAVRGDEIWAVSQLADGMLPSTAQGLLSGTVFVSEDGGETWQERGGALPLRYPTAVALGDDAVCIASLDQGTWCTRGDTWDDLGGPSDPIDLAWHRDDLLLASASVGPWRWDGEAWTGSQAAAPMVGLAGTTALSVDGAAYSLVEGNGTPWSEENAGGAVHLALSFHTSYYHSDRGDSNDDDGYGQDIRVLRTVLDWLDEHPDVRADWDLDNAFTLDGWMATDSPDVLARIQARVAEGRDDVRIMSWNNGAMASSTREEFDEAVRLAQRSGLDAFGRMVPGVQPQENMLTPEHLGWYADHDLSWVTLSYSASGFTGPRLDVDLSSEALYNPVTLRDPDSGDGLTWVPVYHHADALDHGGLRGWVRQIAQSSDRDTLLVLHFDADAESWEHFDREIDAVADLVATGAASWTTIQGYLRTHDPVDTVDLPGDVADGAGDGFQSWAEKDLNHRVFTAIVGARSAADRARFLAGGDPDVADALDAALTPRLLALSTTHFGLASPYLAPDREAAALALSQQARDAAEAALSLATDRYTTDNPLDDGALVLVNPRPSAGTALVETTLRVPAAAWLGPDGVAIFGEDGAELPVRLGEARLVDGERVVPVTFAVDLDAESTAELSWRHDAEGPRAQGGMTEDDVLAHPLFTRVTLPLTACDGVQSVATGGAGPSPPPDARTASAVHGVEATGPFCDATVRAQIDRARYAGLPGLVITTFAQVGAPSDPTLAESLALSPIACDGPADTLTWRTFGGAVRSRAVRAQEAWNGVSADGWVAVRCGDGQRLQVSHRASLRSSMGFAPITSDGGKALIAPLGTLWGQGPWHDAPSTGGTGVGEIVTDLVGPQFRPAAADWSGQEVRYRLLLGEDLPEGTLDLFAHPPLALVGAAPASD